ncbi:hypothetical protein KO525_13950 [Psychrosphaera sp. B3R10]|uniref:hypothetical protein n=1 Tax=unclassified Psychrosphaera TaxID=2641570 RepID=UPI001C08D08A|nr:MULTISPECIES: hypothetical protein [unclassified Psychrosphaera]MBU2883419.1 hypothetical protein [Psychrosphaera sp. I2R16]MBU2990487.1 hypothetical protein [Psychrosphaera sp. B3R10]MDO6719036.1 hypothetical protein [Psychrosphaera sp. 1_MG-2023]
MKKDHACPKCKTKVSWFQLYWSFSEHFQCSKCSAELSIQDKLNRKAVIFGTMLIIHISGYFWIVGDSFFSTIPFILCVIISCYIYRYTTTVVLTTAPEKNQKHF